MKIRLLTFYETVNIGSFSEKAPNGKMEDEPMHDFGGAAFLSL
jgi:hypothetical protein